jgi:phenylalanyl-tRNA synthetase beta chain
VEDHKIVVRRAKAGEQITTLDHVRRTLDPNMLVICDPHKPVALAGVMGGLDSEIGTEDGAVVDVLLESAHFDPRSIRRTARLLRLPSEASYRFERFVDPNLTVPALQRAAELMRELGGGTTAQDYVDVYPTPAVPERILFYTSEVERLLGIKLPPTQVAEVLRRLDFGVEIPDNADTVGQDTTIVVDVPTYRNDVTIQADLVEEVARITGYDQIPETLLYGGLPPQEVNVSLEAEAHLRDLAVECGMDEVITYSVTWSEELARLRSLEQPTTDDRRPTTGDGDATYEDAPFLFEGRPLVTIVNPVSSRQDVMRPTLLPNMMSTLRENLKMQPETPVRIFELGKVYLTPTIGEIEARREAMGKERDKYPRMKAWDLVPNEDKLPIEPLRLVGMISGPRAPRSLFAPDSASPAAQADFFDAKGVVEQLLHRLHIAGVEWVPGNSPLYHPGRSATIHAQGIELGIVGELHPHLIDQWEIPAERVAAWDLDVEALLSVLPDRVRYKTISPFPPVRQDMAFVVNEDTEAAKVAQAIRKAGGEAVIGAALFDIYRDKPIPEGKKSLAFAVTLNSPEKPLSEDEVARIRKKIEGFLAREFGASLRS